MKVSVVIPAHRLDAWLDEAVESALSSKDVTVELVVVINGIEEMENRPWMADSRVQTIHHVAPLGPTLAMITGVEQTTGDYVARLDADDRMLPTRLALQAEYLQDHPDVPLIGTAVHRIGEDGASQGKIKAPYGSDIRRYLVLFNSVTHSSVLIRRSALLQVGGYNPQLSQMEDYDVILRLAQLGPIAVLPEELTEYRIHSGQISRGARPRGTHIDRVIVERRKLGKVLGMRTPSIAGRNLFWRAIQFARYYRVTKPGHEY